MGTQLFSAHADDQHLGGRHHDAKPGGIDGLLRIHAEIERVDEHLHLALRMVVETDAPQHKLRHAAAEHHARQDRVPRMAAGSEGVWMAAPRRGRVRTTVVDPQGRSGIDDFGPGDVGYIPQGYGHSLENVGSAPAKILIVFNSGTYGTVDVSQWIAGQPVDVLAVNFGRPTATFEGFPKRDVFITKD